MARKPKVYEAKVKDDYRIPSVTAFGGREYTRYEWREVPEGQVDAAEAAHPFLEVREVGAQDEEAAEAEAEAKAEAKADPKPEAKTQATATKPEATKATSNDKPTPKAEEKDNGTTNSRAGKQRSGGRL